jgi:Ser/Thr protein kinase RdoA (MazF antagonist)
MARKKSSGRSPSSPVAAESPVAAPYAGLTPDTVLDAVESVGLRCDGRQLALNSYENRVYQIGIEDGAPVVAKFYRPGRWTDAAILEEHALIAELAAAEVPAVPPLKLAGATLNAHGGFRFAVFPRQGGRPPELDLPGIREWLGRFIGRIHAVANTRPFRERPALDIAAFGESSRDYLLAHGFIPDDLATAWSSVAEQALDGVRRCFDRAGRVATQRLHGDCHLGNVLWTDDGPHFVDFDDARMGPAVQDLWMLLSGDREQMTRQLGELVDGYEQFMDFDRRQLHLVEALRTLRLLHYSAWIARRWHDPAFPAAFTWFNTQRYWQDRVLELREQIALMDEAPLVV